MKRYNVIYSTGEKRIEKYNISQQELDEFLGSLQKEQESSLEVKAIEDNFLERLDKEITEQKRNGRTDIYVQTTDLQELGITPSTQEEREFIDVNILTTYINKYKFKNRIKATPEEEIETHLHLKDLTQHISEKEK